MSDVSGRAEAMLAKITPGPWTYRDVIDRRHNVTSESAWNIAACSHGGVDPAEGDQQLQAQNNAIFIALQAKIDAVRVAAAGPVASEVVRQVRKALGEQ